MDLKSSGSAVHLSSTPDRLNMLLSRVVGYGSSPGCCKPSVALALVVLPHNSRPACSAELSSVVGYSHSVLLTERGSGLGRLPHIPILRSTWYW